jgi:hypothetical protein
MGKKEREIQLIKKYIKNVAKGWPAYTYGNIPKSLANNACSEYAGAAQYDDIIGLIDITIAGNAKKGMLFTTSRVYYNNGLFGSTGSVSYKQMCEDNAVPSGVLDVSYNKEALLELLAGLSEIAGDNFQSKINNINSSIDGFNQGVNSIVETLEKGADLMDSIMKIFGTSDDNSEN